MNQVGGPWKGKKQLVNKYYCKTQPDSLDNLIKGLCGSLPHMKTRDQGQSYAGLHGPY